MIFELIGVAFFGYIISTVRMLALHVHYQAGGAGSKRRYMQRAAHAATPAAVAPLAPATPLLPPPRQTPLPTPPHPHLRPLVSCQLLVPLPDETPQSGRSSRRAPWLLLPQPHVGAALLLPCKPLLPAVPARLAAADQALPPLRPPVRVWLGAGGLLSALQEHFLGRLRRE